jgi:hypothetical protein
MKKLIPLNFKTKQSITICFTLVLLLISLESFPQKAADFSGKWILDNSKSIQVSEGFKSTIIISQTGNKITLTTTTIPKRSKAETKIKEYILGTSKGGRSGAKNYTIDAIWLSDKQSFSITEVDSFVENGVAKKSKNIIAYSLTDGGNILTVKSDDILPEGSAIPDNERHTVMIFNKSH